MKMKAQIYFFAWYFLRVTADIERRDDGSFKGEFNVVHQGRVYNVLKALRNIPLQECCHQCIQYLSCQTVNYCESTTECELTNEDFKDYNSYKSNGDWQNYGTPPKVDGQWSSWHNMSDCSEECAGGFLYQHRFCDSPEPRYGGSECQGTRERTIHCNVHPCPVNGNWGDWSGFTTCSKTCKNAGEGDGQQTRRRNCSNPVPQYGGLECLLTGSVIRDMTETEINGCMVIPPFCPINGNWGEWQYHRYKRCNNNRWRKPRYCNNPSPQHGGLACVGADHKCEW